MMEVILAKMYSFREEVISNQELLARMEAGVDVNLKVMEEAIRTNQEKMDLACAVMIWKV
jgi:hypothetical protein